MHDRLPMAYRREVDFPHGLTEASTQGVTRALHRDWHDGPAR